MSASALRRSSRSKSPDSDVAACTASSARRPACRGSALPSDRYCRRDRDKSMINQ